MGQQNCCQISNKQPNKITQKEIDNLEFNLDFNRGSTYKKLETIATEITTTNNISNAYNLLISRIIANQQQHLVAVLKEMNDQKEQQKFIQHLETFDFELVDSLYHNLCSQKPQTEVEDNSYKICQNIDDINDITESDYQKYFKTGLQMIKNKEAGIVILSGGKNIRYHHQKSKAFNKLDLPSEKTMFQLISERVMRLNAIAGSDDRTNNLIPVYIMTNDQNIGDVKDYWKRNNFFGIDPNCITFFMQSSLPVINEQGQVIMKSQNKVHVAPTGPADFFSALLSFGIFKKILKSKTKYLNVIGVDNLLVKPLDPFFLGYSKHQDKEFICKVVQRNSNDEDSQFVVEKNDHITQVMNKKELIQEMERHPDNCEQNLLTVPPVFMNNILVSVDFINRLAGDPIKKFKLAQSYHLVKRQLDWYDLESKCVLPGKQANAYCFEKELGDMIALTTNDQVQLLKVNRDEEYAPLIYEKGYYSTEDAKLAISNLHKKWLGLDQINSLESDLVEISPEVSYNGEQLDNIILLLEKYQNFTYPFHIKSHALLVEQLVQNQGKTNGNNNINSNRQSMDYQYQNKSRNTSITSAYNIQNNNNSNNNHIQQQQQQQKNKSRQNSNVHLSNYSQQELYNNNGQQQHREGKTYQLQQKGSQNQISNSNLHASNQRNSNSQQYLQQQQQQQQQQQFQQ